MSFPDEEDRFGSLLVFNEDLMPAGMGFDLHPHHDVEILTYVVTGELTHEDSLGNRGTIGPGEFQAMTAGTGVQHSEKNLHSGLPCHLFQIWWDTRTLGTHPVYSQIKVSDSERMNTLRRVVSSEAGAQTLKLNQNVAVYTGKLTADYQLQHQARLSVSLYLHVVSGSVMVMGHQLMAGDALQMENVAEVGIVTISPSELLLIEMGETGNSLDPLDRTRG